MVTAEYPFYLIENKPFMRIGELQAAIYWGTFGAITEIPELDVNDFPLCTLSPDIEDMHKPAHYTAHYLTYTDLVIGYCTLFSVHTYTIDLSRERIVFHEVATGKGDPVYFRDDYALTVPVVSAGVDGHKILLQVDIGDELTVLPNELLEKRTPVGTESFYLFETDTDKTQTLVYEVPVQLSDTCTVQVRARPMSPRELTNHSMYATMGCLGVDLIKNNAVTFTEDAFERPVMYVLPFETLDEESAPLKGARTTHKRSA